MAKVKEKPKSKMADSEKEAHLNKKGMKKEMPKKEHKKK
jgi:hypothetical protein